MARDTLPCSSPSALPWCPAIAFVGSAQHMRTSRMNRPPVRYDLRAALFSTVLFFFLTCGAAAQQQQRQPPLPPTPGPMLADGNVDFDTPDFTLTLVKSSQTVAALKPKGANGFDFTPGDLLVARSQDGYHHLGDIELRVRNG